jgi:FKBP-type peptidyl-prolyl cis-trans isomerase FklB
MTPAPPRMTRSAHHLLIRSTVLACLALAGASGCDAPVTSALAQESAEPDLGNDSQKASYGIGYSMSASVRRQFADDLDEAAFRAGIEDAMGGVDRRVSETDADASLRTLHEARAAKNVSLGQAFLKENGARDGVVTLPSGLQYEILTDTDGPKPAATDRVTTHYRGTLIDGTVFDSSYDRGQPATFPLNGVIAGWTEALQLMSVGSKWRLFIPPELAYGARAQGPIPANSTLIFDVELIEIAEAEPQRPIN